MMKLFSALDRSDPHPFNNLIASFVPAFVPEILENPGVLILWGGEDISPSIYNQKGGQFSGNSDRPSFRDRAEITLAKEAIEKQMPIIGVCRGAQLMCALSGGTVIQHVNNHGTTHLIETDDGRTLATSSLHHQMMFPWNIEHQLIAWCRRRSDVYLGEDDKEISFPENAYKEGELIEPEIVWFPTTKTLAIQGHPEFMELKTPFVQYSLELMTKLCLTI